MTGGFRVQPDRLRADGQSLQETASRFVEAVRQAAGGITTAGQPWGNDDIGMIIGETHDLVAQALFDFFADAVDVLRSDGADLVRMAEAYDAVEHAQQARFDRLGEQFRF